MGATQILAGGGKKIRNRKKKARGRNTIEVKTTVKKRVVFLTQRVRKRVETVERLVGYICGSVEGGG